MCGIAGKIDFAGRGDEDLAIRMGAVMEHRGPDSSGCYVGEGAALAVQRLAIIDVRGGDQPITNEDGSVVVVMNGEIYNFRTLREQLRKRGHRFRSEVDTEVLVHLYEDHGDHLVDHLRGMFAFAIWDRHRRRLLCARDRVGKKPLFWARRGDRFWFASEVRALLEDAELGREADPGAIDAYLALGYVPDPLCAFAGIEKLPPACTLAVEPNGQAATRYWSLDYTRKQGSASYPELEERLRDELWEATRLRMASDVPLGALLSGGIDSSAVVAAMADQSPEPIKTFSIGFPDEDFDEAPYARVVAERFATDHHEFRVEPHAIALMPTIARHYGEPFGDSSAIPTFYLAELTSRHVTVALNGDGGDESFGGYDVYVKNALLERHLSRVPSWMRDLSARLGERLGEGRNRETLKSRLSRRMRLVAAPAEERYSLWMSPFDLDGRRRLLTGEFRAQLPREESNPVVDAWRNASAPHPVDRMLEVDVKTNLAGDLVVKMDIATMAHSVETRSPLLDHRLMEFAAGLPVDAKIRGLSSKRILKSALRGIVPDEILDRRKAGFAVPLARWFRRDLRDLPAEILLDESTLRRGQFRRTEVERILREHQEGVDHARRIWVMLQLEMWHRHVLEASPAAHSHVARLTRAVRDAEAGEARS